MKLRNVQKTGNMHYIYLPSKWCRQKNITLGSRLEVDVDSSGNLVLSTKAKSVEKNIKVTLNEDDLDIISKVVMGCFLNPVSSFEVNITGRVKHKDLMNCRSLLSTTMIEIDDDNNLYSEPIVTIDNPLSVFLLMVNKAKTLVKIMRDDYDERLVEQYEEEIDWSNTMINKAVIASFMHKRDAKRKLVELHYLSLISNYLERTIDRVVTIGKDGEIDTKEKRFLLDIYRILENLYALAKAVQNDDYEMFNYKEAVLFAKKVKSLKIDREIFAEMLVKKSLRYCSEVLIDWAITNQLEQS